MCGHVECTIIRCVIVTKSPWACFPVRFDYQKVYIKIKSGLEIIIFMGFWMNKSSGLSLRDGGRDFPLLLWVCPLLIFLGIKTKIKANEFPRCSIPRLLIAYTLQLAILVNDNPEIMLCPVCSSSLITWRQLRQFRLVFFFHQELIALQILLMENAVCTLPWQTR